MYIGMYMASQDKAYLRLVSASRNANRTVFKNAYRADENLENEQVIKRLKAMRVKTKIIYGESLL